MDSGDERLINLSALDLAAGDRLSRRRFLARSGGAAAAITGTLSLASACTTPLTTSELPLPMPTPLPLAEQYPAVPVAPAEPPRQITTLTEHEAATLEALMARILPGDANDPGAREAGVIYYLDHMLGIAGGFPEATYRTGPYAQTYEGDSPPTDEATALADGVIWIPASEIARYGYQSPLTPLEVCQIGVRAVDGYAEERFGRPVVELSEEEQDQIIAALLDNEATGFKAFSPEAFFHALRRHTDEGMFSDPLYGGNIDFAGWRLIGFPGAQRAYTETDIRTPGSRRPPQGLAELHH
ncbi:MAG: gluconate 2-dehydrogenase subunit 3 family protein, partial [Steroidobacter sp.]